MHPPLPEIRDVDHAVALLTARATLSRQAGGLIKESDWKEDLQGFVQNLTTRKANPSSLGDAASLKNYWADTGWESARNALIGAGIGGVGGAASSAFSKRRKKNPLGRALRGALLGAGMGGLGTAGVRGAQLAMDSSIANKADDMETEGRYDTFSEGQDRPGSPAGAVETSKANVDESMKEIERGEFDPVEALKRQAVGMYGSDWAGAGAGAVAGGRLPWSAGELYRKSKLTGDIAAHAGAEGVGADKGKLPQKIPVGPGGTDMNIRPGLDAYGRKTRWNLGQRFGPGAYNRIPGITGTDAREASKAQRPKTIRGGIGRSIAAVPLAILGSMAGAKTQQAIGHLFGN